MLNKATHQLIISAEGVESVVAATFYSPDAETAAKIARAIVRTWSAATKKHHVHIKKDMVRLVPICISK